MRSDTLSSLILGLYRNALEMPTEAFQDYAIGLIKPLLSFESSFWGTGVLTEEPIVVHTLHEHEIDTESFSAWQQLNSRDHVVAIGLAHPGVTIQHHAPTLFAHGQDAPMREFARRFGRQSYLITQLTDEVENTNQWLSLYRSNPDDQYSDDEQLMCQVLMPHLAEALRVSHAMQAATHAFAALEDRSRALIVADASGRIRFAQRRALQRLAQEWPQFDGRKLPRPVLGADDRVNRSEFVGRTVNCALRRREDMILLEVRPCTVLDALPKQRRRIAWLYAKGNTHKEIAQKMRIAPSTVRNQIKAVYDSLGISSKSQLVAAARLAERQDETS